MIELLPYAGISLIAVLVIAWVWRRVTRIGLPGFYGLNAFTFVLAATDHDSYKDSTTMPHLSRLAACSMVGVADAIFADRSCSRFIVGEFKSRKFKGEVFPHEYYQTLLYIGMLKTLTGKRVSGRLRYADAVIHVPFDQAVFDGLLRLRLELETAKKHGLQESKPLHKRMKVPFLSRRHAPLG